MTYLIFSIIFNGLIFLIFRLLKLRKVDVLPTLVVNYITAFIFGYILSAEPILNAPTNGYILAAGVGLLFISIFFLMAQCSISFGMGFSSVLTKLSMIIPVIGSFFLFNSTVNLWQSVGLFLAFSAVLLIIKIERKDRSFSWLPLLLFIGSGSLDLILKYLESDFLKSWSIAGFIPCVFLAAGVFGATLVRKITSYRFIPWGIGLGLINYGSMWFLLMAMGNSFDPALFFPVNNLGIITFSTLLGILIFQERFSIKQRLGMVLAGVSIILMSL
ncbi:MAG: drug/metabolite transporter (DMT)-like permease [Luteibaculaceae bacterium]|jgi:drug/metabolite transporter (DMT)-like permease